MAPPRIGATPGAAGAPDYASAFRVPTAAARRRSPREWTRAVFEGAPAPLALFVRWGWLGVLRLRLSEDPEAVAGWRPTTLDPGTSDAPDTSETAGNSDAAALEAESPLLEACNVAFVDDDGVTWATYVRFRGGLGRAVRAVAARIHHVVIPYLLRRAVRCTERE